MAAPDLSKLNMSPEEAKNMTKLMKDPKFMEMFTDYAREISDPRNKEEMENALRDAENRGEKVPGFPEGKELLIPTAAFCAKTKHEKTGVKVFINICCSDKVKKASGKERPDKSGTEWDIPYSLAPPLKDTDKGGADCDVHDFVVSPETHKLALEGLRFKKFLVETAIDSIERQRGVKLSRDFTLPRLKYKGQTGEPRMLTISKGSSQEPPPKATKRTAREKTRTASETPNSSSTHGSGARSNSEAVSNSSVNLSERTGKDVIRPNMQDDLTSNCSEKGLNTNVSRVETGANGDLSAIPDVPDNASERPAQEVEPEYKVIYRNNVDLAQFWEDKANLKVQQDEVKEIVLCVHLPGIVHLSDIELHVTQSEVTVVVPSKYKLKVPLKYRVDDSRGQAKFDKEKLLYQLEVTLPVIKHQPRVQHDKKTLMM